MPGARFTVWLRVLAHREPALALAAGKTRFVVSRYIPITACQVVDVLTPLRGFRSRFTSPNTKLGGGLEVGPFMDLLSESLFTIPNVREHKATMRVAKSIGSMRVKLSSCITSPDINFREIAHAGNLDVVRSFKEMRGCKGTRRYQPSAMSRNGTVCDNNLLQISYHAIWGRRSPNAKILYRVDIYVLAE
jgi:hypothetical protein